MKAEIKTAPQAFQPVKLELTFETAEELYIFKRVSGFEISVPSLLREAKILNSPQEKVFAKQIATIQKALYGLGN
jgi:hypothetical protein